MNKTRGYGKPKIPVGNRNSQKGKNLKQTGNKNNNQKTSNKKNIGGFQSSKSLTLVQSSVPVSYSNKITVQKPRIGRGGSLIVTHAELLSDVVTDVGYKGGLNVFSCSVNPGLQKVFPWLSNIARNFQEYKARSVKIIYISDCATSTAGQIMMTASYDASLSAPNNETDFSNYEGMVADNVWKCVELNLDKKGMNSQLHYYVRGTNPNTVIKNEDIKLLDCANIYIAYINAPANATLGKLWIEYSFELLRPFSNQGLQQEIVSNSFLTSSTSSTKLLPLGATSGAVLLNTQGKFLSGNWQVFTGTNTWIALGGIGTKMITTNVTGTGVVGGFIVTMYQYNPSISDDGNLGFVEVVNDSQELMQLADVSLTSFTALTTTSNILAGYGIANSGATQGALSFLVNILPGCVLQLNATGVCTTISAASMFVTDVDFNIPLVATNYINNV